MVIEEGENVVIYEGATTTSPEPAFIETGWLTRQYATAPRLPLRFYLEVGSLEQCVNPECPFGDVSLREPRAFSGSLHALRPLAEGARHICTPINCQR